MLYCYTQCTGKRQREDVTRSSVTLITFETVTCLFMLDILLLLIIKTLLEEVGVLLFKRFVEKRQRYFRYLIVSMFGLRTKPLYWFYENYYCKFYNLVKLEIVTLLQLRCRFLFQLS